MMIIKRIKYHWVTGDMSWWKKLIALIVGFPFLFDEPKDVFLKKYYKQFPKKKK